MCMVEEQHDDDALSEQQSVLTDGTTLAISGIVPYQNNIASFAPPYNDHNQKLNLAIKRTNERLHTHKKILIGISMVHLSVSMKMSVSRGTAKCDITRRYQSVQLILLLETTITGN